MLKQLLPLSTLSCVGIMSLRKMSTEEKRKLGIALTRLSPEDLTKALEIVAENNPNFQATAQEVDLDIDAQVMIFLCFFMFPSFQFYDVIYTVR